MDAALHEADGHTVTGRGFSGPSSQMFSSCNRMTRCMCANPKIAYINANTVMTGPPIRLSPKYAVAMIAIASVAPIVDVPRIQCASGCFSRRQRAA